ncbi:hypothetical protein LZ30DRAFT_695620 [Colletotrichum cereale]|nr:hypothetical protein LZ30DRAFT_695620 [Colletotrichum cereale]
MPKMQYDWFVGFLARHLDFCRVGCNTPARAAGPPRRGKMQYVLLRHIPGSINCHDEDRPINPAPLTDPWPACGHRLLASPFRNSFHEHAWTPPHLCLVLVLFLSFLSIPSGFTLLPILHYVVFFFLCVSLPPPSLTAVHGSHLFLDLFLG